MTHEARDGESVKERDQEQVQEIDYSFAPVLHASNNV